MSVKVTGAERDTPQGVGVALELLIGFGAVAVAFSAFLLLALLSVRRVNRIKKKELKTLREIKKGLTGDG
ncbi:MAG: hypothetical protein JRH07_01790 [Deltaproteobacteria bacterium]|nr:hypothetical protein [Deltaproteobacteria bacterium]MBW2120564.1 hypothetical protein [Deltaproteobacteria bacterium]